MVGDVVKQLEDRIGREATFRILSKKMQAKIAEFDRKFELLLETQVSSVVQLKPLQPEEQPSPSHRGEKKKERRYEEGQENAPKKLPVSEEVALAEE
ncbi:hypothetical protein Y032_0100g3227 [Ancylostoma ceylanicum]|uniref:Uncharacterized protein n=1 Tax=Ancylostoma ceylanicum TaxID=53326 RepID=A0A016THZ9_9BILA|nr:hypothetical protein Y032_0100g3227 [Ancylostoma ceylanicum]